MAVAPNDPRLRRKSSTEQLADQLVVGRRVNPRPVDPGSGAVVSEDAPYALPGRDLPSKGKPGEVRQNPPGVYWQWFDPGDFAGGKGRAYWVQLDVSTPRPHHEPSFLEKLFRILGVS